MSLPHHFAINGGSWLLEFTVTSISPFLASHIASEAPWFGVRMKVKFPSISKLFTKPEFRSTVTFVTRPVFVRMSAEAVGERNAIARKASKGTYRTRIVLLIIILFLSMTTESSNSLSQLASNTSGSHMRSAP